MSRFIRELRLIPIALIASACLLVLKIADLALDSGRWLQSDDAPASDDVSSVVRTSPDAPQPPGQSLSWAQQMFNFPNGSGSPPPTDIAPRSVARMQVNASAEAADRDVTGSIGTQPAAASGKPAPTGAAVQSAKDVKNARLPDGDIAIPADGVAPPSKAEREILQRLQQRRQELDERARELDIRENLVKAAEQRIAAHLAEIKEVEAQIKTETMQRDKAEAARFKALVTMYENMKPRDAAKIFDGLDMEVLIKVAAEINPRSMADILAQMTPEMAERLTVALASKAQAPARTDAGELPKIQGTPTP
jgi:flagellar motility protein MotE (MotC chaperone)